MKTRKGKARRERKVKEGRNGGKAKIRERQGEAQMRYTKKKQKSKKR